MIRLANEADVAPMLAIYAPYIEDTAITFDTTVPSLFDFNQKINKIQQEAPCLICEVDGAVVGYAYADAHRSKGAYKWTREVSVYIPKEYQAKKYGTALYYSLIDLLKCQRYRNVVAGITLPNIPSVSFHERFGFHQVGVYDNVGFKLGKSQRVGWWQLSLVDHMQPAEAIIPLDQGLKTEEGQKALRRGELRLMI